MRVLPAVPLTKDNFEQEYKIATGLNFITVKWIETQVEKITSANEGDDEAIEAAKYELYAKLIRNIQLLHDRYVGGELNKYGRFRIFADYDEKTNNEFRESDKLEVGSGQAVPSELVSMLGDIIFDGFDGQYLLGDEGDYILTNTGVRILI